LVAPAPLAPAAPGAQEGQLLAGKFQGVAALEQGYLELQRKLGERPQPAPPAPPAPLSREEAVSGYGEAVVVAAEAQGIDLGQWDQLVRQGADTAPLREKLAGALGIAPSVIEGYERAFRPSPAAPAATPGGGGLSAADEAAIVAEAGGAAAFQELSQWAAAGLSAAQLDDYNAAIDTGNPAAARAAVRWLQAIRAAQPSEPPLLLGGAPTGADVFESEAEALEAKNVLTASGRPRYLVDPKYRAQIDAKFARSNIFG
jgi:hypothetical protein